MELSTAARVSSLLHGDAFPDLKGLYRGYRDEHWLLFQRAGFDSQYPHGGQQPSVIPVPEGICLLLATSGTECGVQIYMQAIFFKSLSQMYLFYFFLPNVN